MKKGFILMLALLCPLWPLSARAEAEGPASLWAAVSAGVEEGLGLGARQAIAALEQEMTLELALSASHVDAGESVLLTFRAGNPLPQEVPVSIELMLPERLAVSDSAIWEAVLPAATFDEQGELVPAVAEFTRELTLMPGGESESVSVSAEMAMGTRYYKAQSALALCVPALEAAGVVSGATDGRIQPGGAYAYRLMLTNRGQAAGEAKLELALPQGVQPLGELPEGFAAEGQRITGALLVPAARDDAPGEAEAEILVSVDSEALDGDADAARLLIASLKMNGQRAPVERVRLCGPLVSAKLVADAEQISAGGTAEMDIVIINKGQADADVRLLCQLPRGLSLAEKQEEDDDEKPMLLPGDEDGGAAAGEAIPVEPIEAAAVSKPGENALIFNVHIDGAQTSEDGLIPAAKTIRLTLRADESVESLAERMVGASLYWETDERNAQLAEPMLLRVGEERLLGLDSTQWSGIFWAALLMLATIVVLNFALRSSEDENYIYD